MPELPEVETVRLIIEPQLAGEIVQAAKTLNPQIIAYPDDVLFTKLIIGQKVQSMSRRGKFLTIHLESGDRLVIHLRMTGQLLVTPADYPIEKHTHFIAQLSGGKQIRYIDVRRFGRFWFFQKDETDNITAQGTLGIEPTDCALSAEYLKEKLAHRQKAIKEMLHDQSIVAGIGNIYSDEILFAAGIYPAVKCNTLSDDDWLRLAKKIPEVILWGIETNTLTPEDYLRGKGKEYRNTPYLKIYSRAGKPCLVCRSTIEKIKIGGRSSCFCPKCQTKR